MGTIKDTSGEYLDRQRVEIENLMPWDVGFPTRTMNGEGCILNGGSYIYLPDKNEYQYKRGISKMTVEEICAQINAGNIGFVGRDGAGQHACIRINDLELYKTVFDLPDAKELPIQLTQEAVGNLFKISNVKKFEEELKKLVVTQSEKKAFAHFASYYLKLNEMPLVIIRKIEEHIGLNISE